MQKIGKDFVSPDGIYDEVEIDYELQAVRLVNFKAFADTNWLKLNKLTFLLGANSSGKSSVFQFFELLRRCYNMLKRDDKFTTLGKLADSFGSFGDLHNLNSSKQEIMFSFKFVNKNDNSDKVIYSITLAEKAGGSVTKLTLKDDKGEHEVLAYKIPTYQPENIFFWSLKDCNSLTHSLLGCKMRGIQIALMGFAEQMQLMQPQRKPPERNMIYSGGYDLELGDAGQNVYQMLFTLSMDDHLDNSCLVPVNKWLEKFGYNFDFKLYKKNFGEFVLRNLKSGKETNIVDNGFGIAQSLPVVVALARHTEGLLMIDSPEAFLQTNMQAELADYLISGAKQGTMLLEIASEYILTRIQRRIAEGVLPNKDVSLYYIYEADMGTTKIEEVQLTNDGSYKSASDAFMDFFSANYRDILEWERAKIKKLK